MRVKKLVLVVLLVAGTTLQAQSGNYNTDDSKIAMQGYSPVSYFDLGLAQLGSSEFKSTYQGVAYYFTTGDQKKKFDSNPAKYVPQYGGWCAFAVSLGAKFRPDPNRFRIVNNKLYLFTNNVEVDAVDVWVSQGETKLIAKADQNWKKMIQ